MFHDYNCNHFRTNLFQIWKCPLGTRYMNDKSTIIPKKYIFNILIFIKKNSWNIETVLYSNFWLKKINCNIADLSVNDQVHKVDSFQRMTHITRIFMTSCQLRDVPLT